MVRPFLCLNLHLPASDVSGEHYATDTLTGAAIGVIPVCLANLPYPRTPDRSDIKVAGCKPVVVLFPGVPSVLYLVVELFEPLIEMGRFIHPPSVIRSRLREARRQIDRKAPPAGLFGRFAGLLLSAKN